MSYCRTVCNVIQKQRTGLCNRIQVIKRGYKQSGLMPPCMNSKGYNINKFIFVESNFETMEKTFNLSRNFSTTACVRASRQYQDKEKMKNYIVVGGLMAFAILVFSINLVINNTHNDHVYIQPPQEKK